MADLKKVIVITGCSSGIGLDTAVLLAKDKGVKVIATMRNLQKKDTLEKAAGTTLNKSMIIKELDVSKEDSIVNFVKKVITEEGKIDVLVNNAATGQFGPFESVSMAQMQALFQTNFFGAARITQEVVTHMKERKSGHIIFISSLAGIKPFPFSDFYVASKFAIEGLVGNLAPVLRCFNIRVTSVEPGLVKTSIIANVGKNNQGGFPVGEENQESEDETKSMMNTLIAKYFSILSSMEQTGTEVGEVIKKCIYEENPPVRVQTSDGMVKMVKKILVDHTGNQVTDELEAYLK
ncbi:Retinol dehydrogenase 8 [Holothuria leucospilota]|uniref:Retinol dehydrogenase 8 n=1 Tax=Holothuria leucospilota TaxID=206669 RepID=A0A9Q1BVT8_HOLLE|nr:Retinol dehydrogenase 8 [Holothuria leucospilota]